jgi:uncharacterized protein (TIGR04168 family)
MNDYNNSFRIAIIGDIHLLYNHKDTDYFNESNYDLLLFVGDLGILTKPKTALSIAQSLSKLQKPSLLIPGNHDVQNPFQIISEVLQSQILAWFTGLYHFSFHNRLQSALQSVVLGGYSIHSFSKDEFEFDVIVARPYAMGGSNLSFSPFIRKKYQIRNMDESSAYLCKLVDQAETGNILFLAHNGPYGISKTPTDIWGCDFNPALGDFGDRDLSTAIQYARRKEKRVLAVVAGHMHLQTFLGPNKFWNRHKNPGPMRPSQVVKDGILYINAALVPRIYEENQEFVHHHISLEIRGQEIEARARFINHK